MPLRDGDRYRAPSSDHGFALYRSEKMDRWRSWNAAKLPGRAVNRFVRGWTSPRLAIEVHRTACIVTHPPVGELANDALVIPANERLAGTRFSPEECWDNLYGNPTHGRWDEKYVTYPFQSIDGLVTEFGGDGLRLALEAQQADATGERCPTGGAVLTRSHGEMLELFGHLVHAVAPFYRAGEPKSWAEQTTSAYHSAFDVAATAGLTSLAVPLLGTGARGIDLPLDQALRVAAEAAMGWGRSGGGGGAQLTARFGVQDSSTAHALSDALEAAMVGEAWELAAPPPKEKERWALE